MSKFVEARLLVHLRDVCNENALFSAVEADKDDICGKSREYFASPNPYHFPSKSQRIVLMGMCFEPKLLSFSRDLEASKKLL